MTTAVRIDELVRSATVVIAVGPDGAAAVPNGSGFFVAPGRVLTCAHCVHGFADRLWVRWRGTTVRATVLGVEPEEAPPQGGVAHPDAAVLAVEGIEPHPCVPLSIDEPALADDLYAYGITKLRTGQTEPDGSVLRYGGRRGPGGDHFYKLAGGQIAPGMSGGPVLNLRTHAVCAMTKATAGEATDIGGDAVPVAAALAVYGDEPLLATNEALHTDSLVSLRRSQAGFGSLPTLVAALLRSTSAVEVVEAGLRARGRARPAGVGEADRAEWAARQLFSVELSQLVALLDDASPVLGETTVEVFELVACCLPVSSVTMLDGHTPPWWVPADTAAAVAAELHRDVPRVVRIATEQPTTRRLVLRRALERSPALLRPTPFGTTTTAGGLPADLVAELVEELATRFNFGPAEWDTWKPMVIPMLRNTGELVVLDPTVVSETALMAGLLDAFGGLSLVVCSRGTTPAAGTDDVLLDVRPPIHELIERLALGTVKTLEQKLGRSFAAA